MTLRDSIPLMRRETGRLIVLAMVVLAVACSGSRQMADPRPNRNFITGEELMNGQFRNVFEAIQSLRPPWLTPRGPDSFTAPSELLVYLDNVKLGGVSTLRSIDIHSVRYIRYYDAAAANTRWGTGHAGGVILVSTQN